MIGTLGRIVFQVSSGKVLTFRDFNRSGAARIEEHNVIGRKPTLEYVGPGLDQITFTVQLNRTLGINPKNELEAFKEARETGQILSLIIGGDYLGRWIIANTEELHRRHDGRGRILVAEISLTLREVANETSLRSIATGQAD